MSDTINVSITLSGGSLDEMNDLANVIISKAVKLAKKHDIRIHFLREQEKDNG